MVNVFDENGDIVARVKYSSNLDFWDGHNMTCGSTGLHKGLTRLKDGRFVLIHGTQQQEQKDHAEIITPEEALREILSSGSTELLDKYPELKKLEAETLIEEEDQAIQYV